jgi:ATP-dependent Lon protease
MEELPVLPVTGEVLFPNGVLGLSLDPKAWEGLAKVVEAGPVLVVARRNESFRLRDPSGLYRTGTVAYVARTETTRTAVEVVALGLTRGVVESFSGCEPSLRALVTHRPALPVAEVDEEAVLRELRAALRRIARFDAAVSDTLRQVLGPVDDAWQLVDFIGANLMDSLADRQAVLEARNPLRRLELVRAHLRRLESFRSPPDLYGSALLLN